MSESTLSPDRRDKVIPASEFIENGQNLQVSEAAEEGARFMPIFRKHDEQFVPLSSNPEEDSEIQRTDSVDEQAQPMEQAAERMARLESEAYQKGLQQGREDGYSQERSRIESALEKLNNITDELSQMKKVVLEEAEEQMVELVLAIGKQVIMEEIITNRSLVVSAVRSAIEKVEGGGDIRIRLNPDDLAVLEVNGGQSLGDGGEEYHLVYIKDTDVPPGGCIVETDRQILQHDPHQRMQEIAHLLRKKGEEK